jgi:hypothetical protein
VQKQQNSNGMTALSQDATNKIWLIGYRVQISIGPRLTAYRFVGQEYGGL